MNKIIAVDFDGTLVENKYPEIGKPLRGFTDDTLFNELIALRERGVKVILWTSRLGKELENAVNFCKSMGLEFDAINDDVEEVKEKFESYKEWEKIKQPINRKIFANIYIDDRALTNNFQLNLGTYLKEVLYEDFR